MRSDSYYRILLIGLCSTQIVYARHKQFNELVPNNSDKAKLEYSLSISNNSSTNNSVILGTEVETRGIQEWIGNMRVTNYRKSRKKMANTSKRQKGMMQRILPYMVIPFLISTALIPLMLISLKLLLIKAAFVGKVAALLVILNMFKKTSNGGESRKKQESLISRLLPLLVAPFMFSTMMLPMVILQMKFMLMKAILLGKLAIIFATFNLWNSATKTGGVYSHNVNIRGDMDPELSKQHYGYTGDEEYGAYVNRRKRRTVP